MKLGAVANAKLVYLERMYRHLTLDASAPANTTTVDIDERSKPVMDMHDPNIVIDLRDQNPGELSIFKVSWEAGDSYLYKVAETAVHERNNDTISYVGAALSIRHCCL